MRIFRRPSHQRGQVVDVGLQSERTSMAWQRTALGVGGVSALLVHVADRDPLAMAPGLLGLLTALGLLLAGEGRYTWTLRRLRAGDPLLDQSLVRLIAIVVMTLALASVLVLVWVGS